MTPLPHELASLAQAIALGDGFQLLVVACTEKKRLYAALAQVRAEAERLLEEPLYLLPLDPYLDRSPGERFSSFDGINLLLQPLMRFPERGPLPHPVVVFDLTGADNPEEREGGYAGWLVFFQRMNERRNGLASSFPGTLILALPPALVPHFAQRAPDFWSVRSGVYDLDAAEVPDEGPHPVFSLYLDVDGRDAALRWNLALLAAEGQGDSEEARLLRAEMRRLVPEEVALDESAGSFQYKSESLDSLIILLSLLFSIDEFHQLLDELPRGSSVRYSFPSSLTRSKFLFFARAVNQLAKYGLLDQTFFQLLASTHPDRRDEIEKVALLGGVNITRPLTADPGPAPEGSTEPELLWIALSRMNIVQQAEIAMQLGLKREHLPRSPRLRAEAIVQQAEQGDRLPDLAAAIRKVAPSLLPRGGS